MSEPEFHDAGRIEQQPPRLALPPPSYRAGDTGPVATGALDVVVLWIEGRPLAAGAAIFAGLTALHLLILNFTGVAGGLYIGDAFIFAAGSTWIEIVLLAFVAYNLVLPTLFARSCTAAYDALRPSLALDDRQFGQTRALLLDPFYMVRLVAGLLWAVLLTPVFGNLLRNAIPGEGAAAAVLTIWMYVRIALTFGLLGASIGFVVMLHHRFRVATAAQLKIDLFDTQALQSVAKYARRVALYLIVLLALAGPAVAQPDAMTASAILLGLGIVLTMVAVAGAMWGVRRAIRAAKKTALAELQTYSRELWRRAYVNNHVAEAVAIPALGAMITVRNEIARISDWPGGWAVLARLATLALIPLVSWFGGQLVAEVMATVTP
jgi:hypothetical protein